MSGSVSDMPERLDARSPYRAAYAALRAAFADGPVADTAQPVAPQAVVPSSDTDGDDTHTMDHG